MVNCLQGDSYFSKYFSHAPDATFSRNVFLSFYITPQTLSSHHNLSAEDPQFIVKAVMAEFNINWKLPGVGPWSTVFRAIHIFSESFGISEVEV